MTDSRFKKLVLVVGLSAATGVVAFGVAVGSGPAMGSPSLTPYIQGGVTTSTTALSATPQIHAAESGKCVKSSPNC